MTTYNKPPLLAVHSVVLPPTPETLSTAEVLEWYRKVGDRKPLLLAPEFDGIPVGIIYRYGHMNSVIAGGFESSGLDLTQTASQLLLIPEVVPGFKNLPVAEVFGSVTLREQNFYLMNLHTEGAFNKPHEAAECVLLHGSDLRFPFVDFFASEIHPHIHPDAQSDIAMLWNNGFLTSEVERVVHSSNDLRKEILGVQSSTVGIDYAAVGVLIRINKYKDKKPGVPRSIIFAW